MGNNKLFLVQVMSLVLFMIVACSEEGTEPEQNINLDPPSELQATRIPGMAAVRLSWKDNSNSETGFAIERRQNSGPFQDRIFTVQNVTTAIDSIGLTIGATYSYRVRALRHAESSSPSNIASITLTP